MSENIDSIIPEETLEEVAVETAEVAVEEKIVTIPENKNADIDLGALDGGTIGTKKPKAKADKPKEDVKKVEIPAGETVAIYSTRNVTWDGVGKVFTGYNIVTPKQAEEWLKRNHIRLATPEEVAKEFKA